MAVTTEEAILATLKHYVAEIRVEHERQVRQMDLVFARWRAAQDKPR